jgi:tetratricopeptide (TPR) repeat protein
MATGSFRAGLEPAEAAGGARLYRSSCRRKEKARRQPFHSTVICGRPKVSAPSEQAESEPRFGQAAEIRKRDRLRGHQAMAGIYLYEKNTAGAEKELRQAVQEMPSDPRARISLGLLYADAQRWNEAFESFEAILKTDPQHYGALYQVGRTGALSGQRLDRAEECLKRYLGHTPGTDDPPLANAHYRLGMV